MSLQFAHEITWDVLREALSEVVSQRVNAPNEWRTISNQKIPRASADELFEEVLESDAATLSISVKDGGGDPRYGEIQNQIDIKLHIKTTNESMQLTGSSMGKHLHNEALYVSAPLDLKELLRQALRSRVGAEHDRSLYTIHALTAIREAQQQRSPLAKLWVDEALSLPRQGYGWGELLHLAEEINGKTEALLVRRLRESPCDESAWRSARENPPPGFSLQTIDAMLRRFETALPKGAQWRICEDGVGPGSRRVPIGRMLFHKVFGFRYGAEDPSQFSDETQTESWFMKHTGGDLPVTLHAFRAEAEDARLAVACIWGEKPDDLACLLVKVRKPQNLVLGEALCLQGSEDFQRRVKQEIARLAPFRWREIKEDLLFVEQEKRALQLADRGASPETQIAQILSWAGFSGEFAELTKCQCGALCEHHKKINDARRDLKIDHTLEGAENFRAQAKHAALQLLQMFLYQKKIDPLALQTAEEHIAQCRALSDSSW
jgi:hypothetical protein